MSRNSPISPEEEQYQQLTPSVDGEEQNFDSVAAIAEKVDWDNENKDDENHINYWIRNFLDLFKAYRDEQAKIAKMEEDVQIRNDFLTIDEKSHLATVSDKYVNNDGTKDFWIKKYCDLVSENRVNETILVAQMNGEKKAYEEFCNNAENRFNGLLRIETNAFNEKKKSLEEKLQREKDGFEESLQREKDTYEQKLQLEKDTFNANLQKATDAFKSELLGMKSRLSELDLAKKKAESALAKMRNVFVESTGDKTAEVTASAESSRTSMKRALPQQVIFNKKIQWEGKLPPSKKPNTGK
uniref:Uncharacterized protein n=1 Tax=Meloidogyne floridensis TaxID=298350 RepID=A0A915PD98_9BILA